MNLLDFRSKIKNLPVFALNDVRKIDPNFHQPQLMYWLKKGYILTFAGEYYIMSDVVPNEEFLYMGANHLYSPSYVSLASVLAYYQVIPESVLGITSISSRKTKQFQSEWGIFSYQSVKPLYMFGYEVVEISSDIKFSIALLEKAVLDYLYLNPEVGSQQDFEGLRWNKEILQPIVEGERFRDYLAVFEKQALYSRVDELRRYINA